VGRLARPSKFMIVDVTIISTSRSAPSALALHLKMIHYHGPGY
jgi:hypothetical protein